MTEFAQTFLANTTRWFRSGTAWSARAARGSIWLGAGSGMENAMRFARQIILAKFLLLPSDAFGTMAMVLAIIGAAEAFTQVGVKEAVIQYPGTMSKSYLNGAWWFSFLRGVALYIVTLALSPFIARFYGRPELIPMLAVALVGILCTSAISPQAYVAIRSMQYSRWVAVWHGGAILGIVLTIILASIISSAWALVIGFAIEALFRCLISFLIAPHRPTFQIEKEHLTALLRYAKGVFGLGFLAFVYFKADIFVIGKLLPNATLGIYSLAYSLVYFPNIFCDAVVSPILMPTLSSLQSKEEQLRTFFLRTTRILSVIFFPLFALMASGAPWLLRTSFGPEYASAFAPFMILCAAFALRIIGGALVTLFFAIGVPELNRRAAFLRMLVMLVGIVPLVKTAGLTGAALAVLFSTIAWLAYNIIRLRSAIRLNPFRYAWSLAPALLISMAIMAIWYLTSFPAMANGT